MMVGNRAQAKILMLFTGVFMNGGIQRFNHTLLAALSALDLECDVLSMHDSIESVGQPTFGPRTTIRGCSGSRWEFSKHAFMNIVGNRYDWILIGHVNLLVFTILAMLFRPFSRTRTALIAHGIEVWSHLGRLRRFAFLRLHTTLCVSRYTRQRVLEQVPRIHKERVTIFPNCLSSTWTGLRPLPERRAPSAPFILSVTRLERGDRYKGIVTVIEAMSQLDDPSIHYIVVGHGNDMAFLREVATRYGIAQRVHFLQGISDAELVTLYAECKAFVLPSGKEGFGIVFLEAMYFGAPVIAAAEKGALDVVKDGETGLLVRFGDSMAIKKAIERLNADAALRTHLRESGRSTVVGNGEFTFSRFTRRAATIFSPNENRAA
jgi:glycosyltransferase involved in cell wall biosynthesis